MEQGSLLDLGIIRNLYRFMLILSLGGTGHIKQAYSRNNDSERTLNVDTWRHALANPYNRTTRMK